MPALSLAIATRNRINYNKDMIIFIKKFDEEKENKKKKRMNLFIFKKRRVVN